jgi:hypothetical protein
MYCLRTIMRKQCMCMRKQDNRRKQKSSSELFINSAKHTKYYRCSNKKNSPRKTLNYLFKSIKARLSSIIVDLPTIQGNNPSAIYHFKHCSWYCTYFIQYNKLYQGTLFLKNR